MEPVVIEDFETMGGWAIAADSSSGSYSRGQSGTDRFEIDTETVYSGNAAAHLSWNHRRGLIEKGIFAGVDTRPMDAIVSSTFVERAKVEVGDELLVRIPGEFIPVVIREVIDYFPTLDPEKKGFVIVNLDRLSTPRNLLGISPIKPNEGWLRLTDDPELRAETIDILKTHKYGAYTLYDTEAIIMGLEADPLAGAGWSGVLMIAFLGVVLVSSLGFVV